jgi:PKHD-type hydroxylase
VLVRIQNLLSELQVKTLRQHLQSAQWVDGRATAGYQGAAVKNNQQLDERSPLARELGGVLLGELERNALFISAALPNRVYPPLFNRYESGMTFGTHVDNAVRLMPDGSKLRTDLSITIFLSEPNKYDGGELVVEDSFGAQQIKLPAGDAILYPASSLHCVTPITRGVRLASFFWIESLVRDDAQRAVLFDMDSAIQRLSAASADQAACLQLTNCYHNLLRMWTNS